MSKKQSSISHFLTKKKSTDIDSERLVKKPRIESDESENIVEKDIKSKTDTVAHNLDICDYLCDKNVSDSLKSQFISN